MKNQTSLFQILDWDSKIFEYKVAKISASNLKANELKKILLKLISKNVRLVYWFVNPTDAISNQAARENNGFLVDNKITYTLNLYDYPLEKINYKLLRSYLHKPLNKNIESLALQSGIYSRFKLDKNFTHNEFGKLYKEWIRRSLTEEIAKDVIVYLDKNIEKGLVTLELKGEYGNIGLISVDKKYQGKSIGKLLVNVALTKFKALGITRVKVATQKNNIIACKFYEKFGFTQEGTQNIYHFWLNE